MLCSHFLVAASRGYSPVAVLELLIALAPPVAKHRLSGAQTSVIVAGGLRSRSSWALEPKPNGCGACTLLFSDLWDLPTSGVESASRASAGRFFITEPAGKPEDEVFFLLF